MATAALRLSTREQRKKLAHRDKPYFLELRRGLALGYRRGTEGGSWLLREFRGGRYVQRRLAAADDDLPADGVSVLSWSDAQGLAIGNERPTVTKPTKLTLAEAAEDYFATRTSTTVNDPFTWKTFISPFKLGSGTLGERSVSELTTGDLEKWLAGQVPATEDKEKLRSARATANRRWTVLRAILNSAFRKDPLRVPSDTAWRRVRPFQKVDRPRTRTLTVPEVMRLLQALQSPLRELAKGSLYTGLRLGEVEALKAGDVGADFVRVIHSKGGLARSRTVPLNEEGAEFFAAQVKDKAADAPAFESLPYRAKVTRQMNAACEEAKIVPAATFHDLRRSYGSLLINAKVAADRIQELLGHADLRMTRRAYAHLTDASLAKAVKKLPSFDASFKRREPRKRKRAQS